MPARANPGYTLQLPSPAHLIVIFMPPPQTARGIALSVIASMLFATMSAYTHWLAPLNGLDLFAWRILWTLPAVLAFIVWRGQGKALLEALHMLSRQPLQALMLVAMAAMLGLQIWLFLWASVNGRALEVSMGYFLLPLTMVLVGRFYYHERLDIWQRLAVACAMAGVLHELWIAHAFSWPSLVVALGYPPYLVLRRRMALNSLVLFTLEMLLLTPLALVALAHSQSWDVVLARPALLLLLLPLLGLLSTLALACYLGASNLLPLGLFGILGYVEPILLVMVATLLLQESLTMAKLATYVPIWLAVGCTAIHSVRLMRQR